MRCVDWGHLHRIDHCATSSRTSVRLFNPAATSGTVRGLNTEYDMFDVGRGFDFFSMAYVPMHIFPAEIKEPSQ